MVALLSAAVAFTPVQASEGERSLPRPAGERVQGAAAQRVARELAHARAASTADTGYLLVRFRAAGQMAALSTQIAGRYGIQAVEGGISRLGIARYRVAAADQARLVEALSADPAVEMVEVDGRMHALATPDDPLLEEYQWAPAFMDLYDAWDTTVGSSSLTIAVVDTGIDASHLDLAARVAGGWNFDPNSLYFNTSEAVDSHSHGTHVAGIAAAVTNNGEGIAGVTWRGAIMPLRALGCDGNGFNSAVASAIVWATDHGARIVNLSLGGPYSSTVASAVEYAIKRGMLVVAAAGNSAQDGNPFNYPAAQAGVLAVGATGHDDAWAEYSQVHDYVQVSAPGGDGTIPHSTWNIVSTMPTYDTYLSTQSGAYLGYDALKGTSMATPQVSGVAALVWSRHPNLSADELKAILALSSDDLGEEGHDPYYGFGRVNARRALDLARNWDDEIARPNAPSKLSGSARARKVTLRWQDNADDETSFVIERGTRSGSTWKYALVSTRDSNTEKYSETLKKAGTYRYRVRACNLGGCSTYAAPVTVKVK